MSLYRIAVEAARPELDGYGAAVLRDLHDLSLPHINGVRVTRLFLLEGDLDASAVERIAAELLADPVAETYSVVDAGEYTPDPETPAVEVHYRPGVMDPVAASTVLAAKDLGITLNHVQTARRYVVAGAASLDELRSLAANLLCNDCIERVFVSGFGEADAPPATIVHHSPYRFELRHASIRDLDDEALTHLSRHAHLFLSLAEMRAVQTYYRDAGREPTDVELETLAQTWSEHCVHKTFKSAIEYRGEPMPGQPDGVVRYDNLLADTIAAATHKLMRDGTHPPNWCLSVFEDNAGIIAFDDEYGLAFKVETHNHPSAIEPYGGAATGIGGCIRDIIGCGLGARPVANTDVFCFAPPDLPADAIPRGVLHPRRVMKGVVGGVRDYGNRMGIPTVNGAIYFDRRYLGNPLVFCGCVGLIPRNRIDKAAQPGDAIVVVGGRTGRDGIHGATFSSAELTDTHADEFSHAVQIGNAITEKKVLDTLLQARDHATGCLYTALTDCGAGGLSSAVGEMGEHTGAVVDLDTVPLKYEGLRYDEIWISEAQERMVLAVPPENVETLLGIFAAEDVEATVIGTFTDDGKLTLRYDGNQVGEMTMAFLHNGVPKITRKAEWHAPDRPQETPRIGDPIEELQRRLADFNTASKEWVIRQYDHEVQGGSVVKPLCGPGGGPSDAAVIRPRLDSERGVAIGCGLCPELADVDPYWMAVAAVDEALRNVVCVGGDPARTAILDNFCWGNCEDPRTLGALVRACQGAHDAAMAFGLPFISGKDSLNNEFSMAPEEARRLGFDRPTIAIPGTLLISAVSIMNDVKCAVTMDLKTPSATGSELWLIGESEPDRAVVDLSLAARIHRCVAEAIRAGFVLAAHDCSEGGLAVAVAEMAIAGNVDVRLTMTDHLFAEGASRYVLEIRTEDVEPLRKTLGDVPSVRIGSAQASDVPKFVLVGGKERGDASLTVEALRETWQAPLRW